MNEELTPTEYRLLKELSEGKRILDSEFTSDELVVLGSLTERGYLVHQFVDNPDEILRKKTEYIDKKRKKYRKYALVSLVAFLLGLVSKYTVSLLG